LGHIDDTLQYSEVNITVLTVFFNAICSPRLHLFDQKDIKNTLILKYSYNVK